MRQFSVCRLKPVRAGGQDRMHDLLADLRTRLVAPLVADDVHVMGRLNPAVLFQGRSMHIRMDQLVTVDVTALGPKLGTVDAQEAVMRGMDLLLVGF